MNPLIKELQAVINKSIKSGWEYAWLFIFCS
jgi:hypothetical protein